ncbi:phosphohydrolase [Brachyspira sp. SAP_772]|uniref:phosphohydrolase n=1 Tax=Brachyspira sp. SAP_772 TaxID=2608385 RepID=UPI0012F4A130|nr:phosphohydrolase [Brachyspira sp. SAP_772]
MDNEYYEIEFETIIRAKTKIYNDDITIKCQNMNGIVTHFEGKAIDIFIEEIKNNNILLKNSRFYTNVLLDEKEIFEKEIFNEAEYFYHIYLNCIPYSNNLKNKNLNTLREISKEKSDEKFLLLDVKLNRLKELFKSNKKLNNEIVLLIDQILTDIGILIRTDFIKYIKNIGNSTVESNKINGKEMYLYHIMRNIVYYLEKEYIYNYIFNAYNDLQDINMLSHSNRVCLMMIDFLHYYNREFVKGLGNKLRLDYKNKYREIYRKVTSNFYSDISTENLENVFKLGIRKFTDSEIIYFAIGSLYHDISLLKIFDSVPMNNFLRDTDNNQDLHALKAYNFIKKTLKFKDDISLLVGLHHDYYGYSSNSLINKFSTEKDQEHILSFEAEDIINGEALAYVPSKILEILDTYDVLVFMNSKKKENLKDVLINMRDNLITNKIKLDPILFNLFTNFLHEVSDIKLISLSID